METLQYAMVRQEPAPPSALEWHDLVCCTLALGDPGTSLIPEAAKIDHFFWGSSHSGGDLLCVSAPGPPPLMACCY